jgi:hypothetical protein
MTFELPNSVEQCQNARNKGTSGMAGKPITRKVILTVMLDFILGGAVLVGTVYLGSLCLASG